MSDFSIQSAGGSADYSVLDIGGSANEGGLDLNLPADWPVAESANSSVQASSSNHTNPSNPTERQPAGTSLLDQSLQLAWPTIEASLGELASGNFDDVTVIANVKLGGDSGVPLTDANGDQIRPQTIPEFFNTIGMDEAPAAAKSVWNSVTGFFK